MVQGSGPDGQVVVQVGDPQRVQGGGPSPVKQLAQEEDELVVGQLGVGALTQRRVRACTHRVLGLADLVETRGEVGQSEDEGPYPKHQHAHGQVHGLAAAAAQVGDGDEAEDGGDVVAAGDGARLRAADLEAALDGGDDDVDEAVDHHALRGREKERSGMCGDDSCA